MWRRVDLMWSDVSEAYIASLFRVEKSASEEPAWAGGCRQSWPYRDLNSDPLVVQPIASRYTDWAIGALSLCRNWAPRGFQNLFATICMWFLLEVKVMGQVCFQILRYSRDSGRNRIHPIPFVSIQNCSINIHVSPSSSLSTFIIPCVKRYEIKCFINLYRELSNRHIDAVVKLRNFFSITTQSDILGQASNARCVTSHPAISLFPSPYSVMDKRYQLTLL
jgi:hypothetical protein